MYRCVTSKVSSGQTLMPSSSTSHLNARYSWVVASSNKLKSERAERISKRSSSLLSKVRPLQRMVTLGDAEGKEDGYSLGTSVGPVVGISDGKLDGSDEGVSEGVRVLVGLAVDSGIGAGVGCPGDAVMVG